MTLRKLALRKLAAGLAVLGAATIFVTPSASADTVRTGWSCQVGGSGWQEAFDVTVYVPATARQGDTVTVTGAVVGTIVRGGTSPAGWWEGAMGIQVTGAVNSWVDVSGMTSPASKDAPYALSGGSGQVTLNTVGTVRFNPAGASFHRTGAPPGYGFGCFDPDGNRPTAATVQVLPR